MVCCAQSIRFSGSILKIEGENASLATGAPEPLYCWAVSSKRYALFNRSNDGTPILRKVSAHGLGHLLPPYKSDNAPAHIPAPPEAVLRSGVERWHCDLWFEIVSAALAGKPNLLRLNFHAALNSPAVSRYSASAPELLRWFYGYNADRHDRDCVKPFGFLLSLHAKRNWNGDELIAPQARRGRPPKVRLPKPVAPFDRDPATIAATAFDRETGLPVPVHALQTYCEALAQYHLHPEAKFLGGDYSDRGTTLRRHVCASGICHIGKEANEWERQAVLGFDTNVLPDYGLTDDRRALLIGEVSALADILGKAGAAKTLRIPVRRLRSILASKIPPNDATARALSACLPTAVARAQRQLAYRDVESQNLRKMVQELGVRATARRLGTDPSNLLRKLKRKS